MPRIIRIGTCSCEWQESQTCLTRIAVIPASLEDGALCYAATLPLLLEIPPPQKPGGFFRLTDALAFVPLLSSNFREFFQLFGDFSVDAKGNVYYDKDVPRGDWEGVVNSLR